MEILKWVLIVYLLLAGVSTVMMIDEERKPITRGGALLGIVVAGVFIFYLLN